MSYRELTQQVIGCAIEVHKYLGPGLLESTYEECLAWEISSSSLRVFRQFPVPIRYKSESLDCGYRIDLMVEQNLIIELKAVEALKPIHEAQILTYMKLANKPLGLLLNFNVKMMKQGIKRFVL